MDTKQKRKGSMKKNAVTYVTILVVVSLIVVAVLLAASNFNFVDFLIKLHGG